MRDVIENMARHMSRSLASIVATAETAAGMRLLGDHASTGGRS